MAQGAASVDLRSELNQLLDALQEAGIPYALCGGMALAVHGLPRFTQDIELLIQESDLPKVQAIAGAAGFTVETGWLVFAAGTDRERRLFRLLKPVGSESLILDLLCVTEILQPVWNSRLTFQLPGRTLSVVSRDGLIAMKRLSGRAQDILDIRHLEGPDDE